MKKEHEIQIKEVFEKTIPTFINKDGKVSIDNLIELGDSINAKLRVLRFIGEIRNDIDFYCGFYKWIEEDEITLADEEVDSWEDAEELKLAFHIGKDSNHKSKREEKLLEECLQMVKDVVDSSLFMDASLDIWLDESKNLNEEIEYTYMGSFSLTKHNFNTNHPNHAFQGSC